MRKLLGIGAAAAAALAGASVVAVPGMTAPASAMIFVSPSGSTGGTDAGCGSASHTTIQSAVNDVAEGGTVYVCTGTYKESVSIGKTLTLRGLGGAVIDATGFPYGIGIGANNVTVRAMIVENATADQTKQWPGDGIVTASLASGKPVTSNDATIVNNALRNNGGAGIDLESTHGNVVAGNRSVHNDIGINVSDDLGKASYANRISGNITNRSTECGIVLADHSGLGIFNNVILGNIALYNGAKTRTGAGIQLASPTPGGSVRNTVVRGNTVYGNGHGGITMHSHIKGQNFTNNRFVGNTVGRNNLQGDQKDLKTTGIYIGSVRTVTVLVARNSFYNDKIGVFTIGGARLHRFGNNFNNVGTNYVHVAVYPPPSF